MLSIFSVNGLGLVSLVTVGVLHQKIRSNGNF